VTEAPKRRLRVAAVVLGILVVVSVAGWLLCAPRTEFLQGEVEATQVDIAAKIAARVDSLHVERGQTVHRGDLLVTLHSPEIEAKLAQATSAARAAQAQSAKAGHGAREEELRAAESQWRRAEHAVALAESTFRRVERLHRDGVVSTQRRDEAETGFKTARDAADGARALYDQARHGARSEDREAASALAGQAAGAVSEVRSYLGETRLVAPRDGEVADLAVDAGELASPGYPIVSLVDLADEWVVLQVREDRLHGLKVGDALRARFPALGRAYVPLIVSGIAPLGDYATWRATNASGDFDLKTFEVRARPAHAVPGLRPGMSALVPWPRR
jgi:HlyD family secretion protein